MTNQTGPALPRLSGTFLFVLAVVIVVTAFSAWRPTLYRAQADELHDRFFKSTQYIGDLRELTAAVRADEALRLVRPNGPAGANDEGEMKRLDNRISLVQHSYEAISHDRRELVLYDRFHDEWSAYRRLADQVMALTATARDAEATTTFLTSSKSAFDAAGDTLRALSQLELENAQAVTLRADAAYRDARLMTLLASLLAGLMIVSAVASSLKETHHWPNLPWRPRQ